MLIDKRNIDFQNNTVKKLLSLVLDSNSKQVITIKAPTASGKTIMLIDFIDQYLMGTNPNMAFIWLCPGKGNLEEQSKAKMEKFAPHCIAQSLLDALLNGFEAGSTTFVNWELVTNKNNTALRDGEWKNLFDRILEAERSNLNFMVIIDEEHSNNTAKANNVINAFSPKHIIRVSATAKNIARNEYIEIKEDQVIDEGLITKAIYVNEEVTPDMDTSTDYDSLIELADNKRKEISAAYQNIGKNIRPLVLIQFPNGQPETIKAVEDKLEALGYTYKNGLVSIWMSNDKKNLPENITDNDAIPVFMLMKQAISTGWDCPRAKILVKLREGMNQDFEIQTLGRIRRMPEHHHYGNELLDFCYIYTFDEKYKQGLLSEFDRAYEVQRLFLKEECKSFSMEKQLRDQDFIGLGPRDVQMRIYKYYMQHLNLTNDYNENREKLENKGYIFGKYIYGKALQGKFIQTESLINSHDYIETKNLVDTHKHGIYLMHSVDEIKTTIHMQNRTVQTILERLFRKQKYSRNKLLSLDSGEFYAFIINNVQILKDTFREVTAGMAEAMSLLPINPKTATFHIPEQDFFKYDSSVKDESVYSSNAYQKYTSGFATSVVRSNSEMLFEQFCEQRKDIKWVYKNGDTGQQYFSVVYVDGLQKQWLFYADYIVMKKDGTIWVIETKGGES